MATSYVPFNGNAGTVKVSLNQFRKYGVNVVPEYLNHVLLNVIDYSETMEDSQLNDIYEDINGILRKNHFGDRRVISFSVVNSPRVAAAGSKTNRRAIQELVQMINTINKYPKSYRLVLQYRDDAGMSTIYDAVFTGKIALNEFTNDSNVAQIIPLEFKAASVSEPYLGLDVDTVGNLILETAIGGGTHTIIIKESSTEINKIPIVLESNQYNLTP